jgi:hypothetical protein
MKIFRLSAIMLIILLADVSCELGDEGESGISHNTGKNCLSCHSDFKLAGSVYNKSLSGVMAGATITVTSQANGSGTLLGTVGTDKAGNFYTTGSFPLSTGVYVSVKGTSGIIKYMSDAVTNGGCNSCHGMITSNIWAE